MSPLEVQGQSSILDLSCPSHSNVTWADMLKKTLGLGAGRDCACDATLGRPTGDLEDTHDAPSPPRSKRAGRSSARRRRRVIRGSAAYYDREAQGWESLKALFATGQVRKETREGLEALYARLLKSNGVEFALRALKEKSASARRRFIFNQGHREDAQVSFLSRSLPKGTAEQARKSLEQHRCDFTSVVKTDEQLLRRAATFAKRWARRFMGDPNKMASPGFPNNSSCTERTVRQGGLLGLALELGIHPRASELASAEMAGYPPQDAEAVARDLSLSFHGLDLSSGPLVSKPVALRERGLKIRVITKSPASQHFLGHSVRKRLLSALSKCPPSSAPFKGCKDEDILALLDGAKMNTVVSSDLTRATDLFPLDLVSAIIDGLAASGKLPKPEEEILRQLCGSQLIDWGSGPEPTTRGILMGLPCTWSILSIIHLFWWDEAISTVSRRENIPLRTARAHNRYAICGDDAVFAGYTSVADEYKAILTRCHAQVSPGKHFEVSNSSTPRCVFLERLYHLGSDSSGILAKGLCYRDRAIPLRGLVRPDAPDQVLRLGGVIRATKVVKYLLAVDSLWGSHPGSVPVLINFVQNNSWLRAATARVGLLDGIRLSEGGSGLPCPTPSAEALRLKYRGRLMPYGVNVPSIMKGIVDSNWLMAQEMVNYDLLAFVEDGTLVYQDEGLEAPAPSLAAPYVNAGELQDFITRATADVFVNLTLMMGSGQQHLAKLSERSLARAVKAYADSLPPLPEGADLNRPPARVPKHVWVRRTWASGGVLLFPRWVGETRASEAAVRSRIFRSEFDGIGRSRPNGPCGTTPVGPTGRLDLD